MKNNDPGSFSPTRRSVLATGAVFSAGLAMTSPLMASTKASTEIEAWEKFKGKVFVVTGPSTARRSTRKRLLLADVKYPQKRDRKLPSKFRDPFLLVFSKVQGGVVEQGEYQFVSPDGDRLSLFINEIMAYDNSGKPMVQAAFN